MTQEQAYPNLVIVDGQRCFDERYKGLPVPGSKLTGERTGRHIVKNAKRYSTMHATFDTHPHNHWSFKKNWMNKDGSDIVVPGPHRLVTIDDIENGDIVHRWGNRTMLFGQDTMLVSEYAKMYVNKVGQIDLWDDHGIPDEPEYALQPEIAAALRDRAALTGVDVNRVQKGYYPHSDQYGGLEAALPNPAFPETGMNNDFLTMAAKASVIVFAGLEGTHCVKDTFLQVVRFLPNKVRDFVILEDLVGVLPDYGFPGTNFPQQWEEFKHDMVKLGVTITNSDVFRP